MKCRIKPLKVDELIKQGHPLFIDKFLGSEARYDYNEVGNRAQYVENICRPLDLIEALIQRLKHSNIEPRDAQNDGERTPASFADLKPGQKVEVNFTGPVAESYPVQATAGEVMILKR